MDLGEIGSSSLRLKEELPDLLSDRDKIADGLVPKTMDAVFGQQETAWKTERRPSKSGSGYTTWIVIIKTGTPLRGSPRRREPRFAVGRHLPRRRARRAGVLPRDSMAAGCRGPHQAASTCWRARRKAISGSKSTRAGGCYRKES
jgi:hypothetical protein